MMGWSSRAMVIAGVAVVAAILPWGSPAGAATGDRGTGASGSGAIDLPDSTSGVTYAASRRQAGPYAEKANCDEMRGRLASIGYSTTPCWFNTFTLGWHFEYWK